MIFTKKRCVGLFFFIAPWFLVSWFVMQANAYGGKQMALQKEQDIICESKAEGQPFIADLQGNCFVKVK